MKDYILDFLNILLIDIFLPFSGKGQFNKQKVNVAIKSYVISILTGSTFDGFIDCTDIMMVKDLNENLDIIDQPNGIAL